MKKDSKLKDFDALRSFKIVDNSKRIQIIKLSPNAMRASVNNAISNLKLMTGLSITKKLVQNALYEIGFYDPDKSTE